MIFYVVYVKGEVIADCLNAILFLAKPSIKHRAHITVRGPYEQTCDMSAINASFDTIPIVLDGVGRFTNPDQHVVYLSCKAKGLEPIAWRSDFPSYIPHLTLYSGPSPELADEIYAIANRYQYHISLYATKLEPLIVRGRGAPFSSVAFNGKQVSVIAGHDIRAVLVPTLSLHQRLGAIDRLCKYVSQISEIYKGRLKSLTWDKIKSS
ncbi:MAG: 2'-5' RNA ligase family protein [bacterium]|nr:2'-5' RNA ligase family protein [bacterium]